MIFIRYLSGNLKRFRLAPQALNNELATGPDRELLIFSGTALLYY